MLNQQVTAKGHFRVVAAQAAPPAMISIAILVFTDLPALERTITAIAVSATIWSLVQLAYATKHGSLPIMGTLLRPALGIAVSVLVYRSLQPLEWLALPLALLALMPGLERPQVLRKQIQSLLRKRSKASS